MSVADKQREMIERYRIIEDPQERLAAITSRGRKWPGLTEAERIDSNRVNGCSSRVWLVGELVDGVCRFRMDADSPLVKGLATLLCELYHGGTPADVVATEPDFSSAFALDRMLSPTRLHGMASIRATIRAFAEQHA